MESHGKKNTNENYIEIYFSPILLTKPQKFNMLEQPGGEKHHWYVSADCVTPTEETLRPRTKSTGVSTAALNNPAPGPITQVQPHSGELIFMGIWWNTTQP